MRDPIIIHKELENNVLTNINNALYEGLPMFCVEAILKNIFSEVQQKVNEQYAVAMNNMNKPQEISTETMDNAETPST